MKKLLILFICFLAVGTADAQLQEEKARLEKERQEIQREIQEIQSNYNKVKGMTKESLAKLRMLQRKVELQDRLISNINREIRNITDDIWLSTLELNRLRRDLDTLKEQYARNVVFTYMNQSSYEFINFIFSADDFNEAMKRIDYLKSFRDYRRQQVDAIIAKRKEIEEKKRQLEDKHSQKKNALQNQQQQLNELENQKKERNAVVTKLKAQEKALSKEIATKKKRDKQLQNQIAAIVRREIEKAKKEAEKKAKEAEVKTPNPSTTTTPATTTTTTKPEVKRSYLDLNADDVKLNEKFELNKGKLPWPVDKGIVTIPFGTSKVDELMIDNPGITISTPSAGIPVKAIFEGEVSAVSNLGDSWMVMIRHGKYFSVYSNLGSVSVSKGAKVSNQQVIGTAGRADDGSGGQVDLILMNESKNFNPTPWLRR